MPRDAVTALARGLAMQNPRERVRPGDLLIELWKYVHQLQPSKFLYAEDCLVACVLNLRITNVENAMFICKLTCCILLRMSQRPHSSCRYHMRENVCTEDDQIRLESTIKAMRQGSQIPIVFAHGTGRLLRYTTTPTWSL
jgi:hypothetical protein